MRAGIKTMAVAGLGIALAGCGGEAPSDQNIAVDNIEANADIDVLPPDESSASPSDDAPVNGTTDDANMMATGNQTDSY